ncbi:hypothetical protein L6R50_25855 [Myxococcota bacterium]|nr:hypothetical protein [Myxococcota bacterium]
MRAITPMGALLRGICAGVAGSAAQGLFFKATASLTPGTPEGAFHPPDPVQEGENATQAVARRFVEGFARRGPLTEEGKERGGALVHYAFGSAWGGLYGLLRESYPAVASPPGVAAYSLLVWNTGDNLILPAFRLAAPATHYPPKNHAYAIAAHLAFGFAVAAAYELTRPRTLALAAATAWAFTRKRRAHRVLPARAHGVADRFIDTYAGLRA